MKLRQYLRLTRMTWVELADKAHVSRQTLYNVMAGRYLPTHKTMSKIEKATDGKVTTAEMMTHALDMMAHAHESR